MSQETAAPPVEAPAPAPAPEPTPAPPAAPANPPAVGGPVPIKKSDITTMFESLGYAEAKGWSPARIGKKIGQIPELEKDAAFVTFRDKLSPESRALYDQIKGIVVAQGEIKLVTEGEEEKPKAKKAKKTGGGGKKKGGAASPPRKSGVERDAFGSSKGTRGFDAMKVLLTKEEPIKIADIVKESGHDKDEFTGVFYNFLNGQVKKGNVKKSDKGYAITAAGKRLAEKFAETPAPATPAETAPAPAPAAIQEPAPPATV